MLQNVAGIFLTSGFNHLEKYESQWEGLSHILWKIKNVLNQQPVFANTTSPPLKTCNGQRLPAAEASPQICHIQHDLHSDLGSTGCGDLL